MRDRTWPLWTSGLYLEISLVNLITDGYLKYDLYLQGGLHLEVVFTWSDL